VPALAAIAVAGCGDDGSPKAPEGVSQSAFERQLRDAQNVSAADFPASEGKTLQQMTDLAQAGPQVGLATSVLEPGENRLAFGVIGSDNAFVYGKSAVYVARTPGSKAKGPFPAPADTLLTKPAFRSRTAASEKDPIASIYAAQVPFTRPGKHAVLVITKTDQGLLGAPTEVNVVADSPIPAVGERAPAIDTDTLAEARGNIEAIDTRIPPARELHETSLKDALGRNQSRCCSRPRSYASRASAGPWSTSSCR
jgi:hypothetical protein